MSKRQKIAAVALVLLLAAAAYGLFRTNTGVTSSGIFDTDLNAVAQPGFVDQTPLTTAQRLALLATGEDEAPLAQEALRLADHEVDLAFAAALRSAAEHPPALTAEAKAIQKHLAEAESAYENDKARIEQLTAEETKAQGEKKLAAGDGLAIAKAQLDLDQDEVEDAKQDLIREGGDPKGRIQAMVQEHEAAAHDTPALSAAAVNVPQPGGLVHRLQQWYGLYQKRTQLGQAKQEAATAAGSLSARHDVLVAKVEASKSARAAKIEKVKAAAGTSDTTKASGAPAKAGITTRSNTETNSAVPVPASATASVAPSSGVMDMARGHEQAALLVRATKERSAQQNELATFDRRIEAYKDLAAVYEKWSTVVSGKQRSTLRRAIWGVTVILSILLLAIFFSTWTERLLGKLSLARRQVETLRAVTRLTLQIFAVLLTLLVIFGPPSQLGTFLGLAGAGLTVALKDFIVSFVGWFVLMGRNGIRLGDWVEINGVSGEVVELGMFHTVLLETGNWTDSGHPTGRRVTFTNSFAIEGHYFNFSTSGQWLWDELQIVLPAGKDPFPVVDAIHAKVMEVTAESAGLAEKEWKRAARSRDMSVLSAAPAINVRPVIGGIELGVRYITRASERYQLRSKLYEVAVNLLASKEVAIIEQAAAAAVTVETSNADAEPELAGIKR
jgi:small-conductance mechanosensitive channel